MQDIAKILIVTGVVCIVIGVVFFLLGKLPSGGKLPGDIVIKRDNFTFVFPVMTCVILSIILSLIMYFLRK